jgi:hypothetical protein
VIDETIHAEIDAATGTLSFKGWPVKIGRGLNNNEESHATAFHIVKGI